LSTVVLAAMVAVPAACASTKDIESSDQTKSTIRDLGGDLVDPDDVIASGSAGAREIQKIIDRLVASNDACAILTQKDVKGLKIDPTTLASSSARQALTKGVIAVYDHLIDIVPDAAVKPALVTQRDTFVQVLDLVERYTANPTSKQGNDQIQALITGDAFVKAATAVSSWTYANCS
jgi:hypothetical protein